MQTGIAVHDTDPKQGSAMGNNANRGGSDTERQMNAITIQYAGGQPAAADQAAGHDGLQPPVNFGDYGGAHQFSWPTPGTCLDEVLCRSVWAFVTRPAQSVDEE